MRKYFDDSEKKERREKMGTGKRFECKKKKGLQKIKEKKLGIFHYYFF